MDKLSCTLRKEDSSEVNERSPRGFQLAKQSCRKSQRAAQQFFGYCFRYLYCNTIVIASILASPSAHSYGE